MNLPLPKTVQQLTHWVRARRIEPAILVALLAICALTWGFVEIASEVREGDLQAFDQHIVDALRSPENPHLPRGPRWLAEAGRDITALGGPTVLALMTSAAAGYLALRGKFSAMGLIVLAVTSSAVLSTLLKAWFERPRPPVASDMALTFTSSFPSGHSMLSAFVYLVLGTLLARMESDRKVKIYLLTVAVLLTVLVGMSRVYLGVHYPTDVLGGWTAGLALALAWWFLARWFQHRQIIEPPTAPPPSRPAT